MPHRTMSDDGRHGPRYFDKALTQRLGRDVGRLFFDHLHRQPGEPLEN